MKVPEGGDIKPDTLHGLYDAPVDGKPAVVEYEADADLRDTEQVPLLEDGGIAAFIRREVLPAKWSNTRSAVRSSPRWSPNTRPSCRTKNYSPPSCTSFMR
ncbi:hypothetical protein [Polaromonas glacialis]|uniref:hypothetical protein n=1 Tax=Polaromonas glacialis TaxID=866564 RepID=UPI0018DBC742|nr:hypothetical protein [Polaromonas glacialis]